MDKFLPTGRSFWAQASLKIKMAVLVSALVFTLTLAVSGFLVNHFERQLKQNHNDHQLALVTSLAESLDDKFDLAQQALLAAASHLPPGGLDVGAAQEFLDVRYGTRDLFDRGLFLYNPGGDLIVESPVKTGRSHTNFAFREYFRRTVASGLSVISTPYISSLPDRHPEIMVTAPIHNQVGELVAVMGGALDLLGENFLAHIAKNKIGKTGYLYLFDANGTNILSPDSSLLQQQDVPLGRNAPYDLSMESIEGTGETVNSSGQQVIYSFKRLNSTNWILVAYHPTAEVYASVKAARKVVVYTLLPIVIVSLVASLGAIHVLLRPLELLTEHVRDLTTVRAPRKTLFFGKNEISILAEAFHGFIEKAENSRLYLLEAKTLAEAERTKSEAIIAAIGDPLIVHDRAFRVQWQNPAARDIFGDIRGKQCYRAIYGREASCPDCALERAFQEGKVSILERRVSIGERTIFHEISASPVRDADDRIVGGIEIIRDITERKEAEARIRKLSLAVEQSSALVMITDLSGTIEYINPKYSRVTGFFPEDLVGKNVRELGVQDSAERENMWRALTAGEEWQGEFCNKRKNEEIFYEAAAISPVKDQNGTTTHFVKVSEDISERKTLENQLRHAQKMEAIGQLAGGIAHDFNNLLTAIIGYASIQQFTAEEGSTLKADLTGIIAAADRGAKLSRDLLAFSRKRKIDLNFDNIISIDLNEIVTHGCELLQRMVGMEIEMIVQLASEKLPVRADGASLEQALLNLGSNAKDAMPRGGRLSLYTELVDLDQRFVARHGYGIPGQYALLLISDTGSGMDKETIGRIFEPFFTTKEVNKGTGLGLSITYGIIKQHKGYILCDSKPGQGTTFRIFLPLDKSSSREQEPAFS